ncbi:Cytochrome c-type biogenesis protein CcmE [Aquicella siphonis]|uniref:Cytochrome c-type biogenesis protein CcmE n=1 Tax=Aquicella siphonis TaxID=254247 RepID=A0A5E4PE77_9COXI|nr:cytochrome c maturation protein CcmE [Aquicella siphonis]VVC74872.1 Cytochrome c-type biogenesis protein CcmE [Aquicella siphonis]
MNYLHKRRLYYVGLFVLGLAAAAGLILYALKQNINVFLTPGQIAAAHLQPAYHFRLGGMVKNGSVKRDPAGLGVEFIVTDFKRDLPVRYTGILPDLFREGKGVIAEGSLDTEGRFIATQVLAKHDENYMPKNVYKAMYEKTGVTTVNTSPRTDRNIS